MLIRLPIARSRRSSAVADYVRQRPPPGSVSAEALRRGVVVDVVHSRSPHSSSRPGSAAVAAGVTATAGRARPGRGLATRRGDGRAAGRRVSAPRLSAARVPCMVTPVKRNLSKSVAPVDEDVVVDAEVGVVGILVLATD